MVDAGVRERLLNAVEVLATSADPLPLRIAQLVPTLIPLRAADFGDATTGEAFAALVERMRRNGTWEQTAVAMSPEDARAWASQLIAVVKASWRAKD